MPLELFDTHCHLQDEQLYPVVAEVVEKAQKAGVSHMVCIGIDAKTSQQAVEIAQRFEGVYAAVGVQPNYCHEVTERDWDLIVELATDPNTIAIGETGLDTYWDFCPLEAQRSWFVRHIEFSRELNMPFVVHMRDCESEIIDVLEKTALPEGHCGIMHSFSGSIQTAERALELGMHISFAGMVTYKKAEQLRAVAKSIPVERILIETDAPYLSPHPKRGVRPNHPGLIVHTAQCLAELHGLSLEQFCRQTHHNAVRLFKI